MQCFIDSIILTISLVLKLLSFCGFRALFLLLLQIKFPQWFVSFERQKMCVGYKICARACLLVCVSEQYVLLCIPLHACIMDVCTFAHSYSCSHVHIVFIYVSVAHICACVSAYIWGSLYVCRLGHIYACVCVWSRSDFYLYQSCIISSLFKHCLLCMSWNKIQFCVCKVSFFPI